MQLRRLEIQGFKSFASRTDFVFPSGVTAVIGPNGSGKSNVADAIRWALGEQSVRTLRGKSTSDLIFSGGKRRSQSGMAEVTLHFDNSGGWLPIDFTEVTIGRRAYRSGENTYLLNGKRVRLRDISNLLAESGLGERTYTVIGQGLVDTALSLHPRERRALFEEAAGISVYRSQREKSAQHLTETKRNLERAHDILSEISPRLKRLEQQVERFREHERVADYLIKLQRTWYGFHWGKAQQDLYAAREREEALEQNLTERLAEADQLDSQLAQLRQEQTELRASLRDAYRQTADLHDQMDSAQQALATVTERTRLFATQREETLTDLEPLLVQLDAQEQRVQAAHKHLDEIKAQVQEQDQRVATLDTRLQSLREELLEQTARKNQAQQEIVLLQDRQREIEKDLTKVQSTQVRLQAEKELLARLKEEGAALGQGIRTLTKANLPSTIGLVSTLIQVPEEWEIAVEAALAARTQALVVEDWEAVESARRTLGPDERATLLPLQDIKSQPAPKDWHPPEGATLAADAVTCDSDIKPALQALLGTTLLVDDLETAHELLEHLPPGGQYATRSGEILSASGIATIGASSGGIITQERVWRELPQRLEEARLHQQELELSLTGATDRLETLQQALQEAAEEESAAATAVNQAEGGPLLEARTELAVARQALESQQLLVQRELTTLERLKSQVDSRKTQADDLVSKRTNAEQEMETLQEQTTHFRHQLGQVRAKIGPAEEELNRLIADQEEVESQQRQARARVRQMEDRMNHARLDTARCQDRLERLQERMQEDLGLLELEIADQVTAQSPLPLRPVVSQLPVIDALPEGLEAEIRTLKASLRQLGPINPNAPNEYAETLERHEFLSEQVTDLETTSARLFEVIRDLDEMMEHAFREVFQAVAAEFEDTFTRLFNGGSARLELTDPENLMDSGVDIVARPPGKRLQGLALLSGGERALTAAALIFALLRACPTPFCVLDEVDAMLDEANVGRFRSMLEELTNQIQFIVITHNRHTVEAAETVYGVSMGSEGVSQVVSLQLEED